FPSLAIGILNWSVRSSAVLSRRSSSTGTVGRTVRLPGPPESATDSARGGMSQKTFIFFSFDNARTFADGETLIDLDPRELFDFLCCWPFHFDEVNRFRLAQTEVQTEIVLRHHTAPTGHLSHLRVVSGHHSNACADSGAVAPRADQFDLNRIVLIAALVP